MSGGFDGAAWRCVVSVRVLLRACGLWECCVTIACALAVACGDDTLSTQPEGAHLLSLRLPPLGCFVEIETPGSCRASRECASTALRCVRDPNIAPEDRKPVSLACGEPWGALPARATCTRAEECASGLCALTGQCLEPCVHDQQCGEREACRPIEVRLAEHALAPVNACTRTLALPDDVNLAVAPDGFDLARGRGHVDVPGAEASSLVYVQGTCGVQLDVLSVRANDLERLVYDRERLQRGERQENTVLHDGSALAALMYPNNPALTPSAGGLELELKVAQAQHAEVVVASRPRGLGLLDLNVFYVGGGGDLVEGGFRPGEPLVAAMLAQFDARLRELGLALGRVREFDVVGALREELTVLDVPRRTVGMREVEGRPQGLDRLFRLSAGLEHPGVNVFIIGEMGDYIGIAGGIPGPLGLHGSERSGVALAADLLGDLVGAEQVLLHELGHYLGLFHTTESNGVVLEPLTDTPECGDEQDQDDDGVFNSAECAAHGADNLMFWTGPGTLLSAQQIAVLVSSIVLR